MKERYRRGEEGGCGREGGEGREKGGEGERRKKERAINSFLNFSQG